MRLDAGDAFLEGILLNDGDDPALVDPLDRLRGQVPAEHLDLVRSLPARRRPRSAPISAGSPVA